MVKMSNGDEIVFRGGVTPNRINRMEEIAKLTEPTQDDLVELVGLMVLSYNGNEDAGEVPIYDEGVLTEISELYGDFLRPSGTTTPKNTNRQQRRTASRRTGKR